MKSLWYILAFGVSVSLHASLLLWGDPSHTATIPQSPGRASLTINLVASIDSQASHNQTSTPSQTSDSQQSINTSQLAMNMLVSELMQATSIPRSSEPMLQAVTREVLLQHTPKPHTPTESEVVIEHKVAKIDESQLTQAQKTQTQDQQASTNSQQRNSDIQPQGVTTDAQMAEPFKSEYPMIYRRRGIEGTVTVEIQVTASGSARSVAVKQSSGYTRMDAAAIKACHEIRYTPALLNGKPIDSVLEFDVVFKLQNNP